MTTSLIAEEDAQKVDRQPVSMVQRIRTLVGAVVLLAVLAGVGIIVYPLIQGTWMVTPVLSGSMRPGFAVGGVVVSERVPVDSLAVRDVIVFNDPFKPSEQIVHRIVHIAKGRSGQLLIITQGDANMVRDPWTLTIPGGHAYLVRWAVPLIGYVSIAYQNHRGLFLLGAGLVLLLIALSMVFSSRRTRHHRRRRSRRNPQLHPDSTLTEATPSVDDVTDAPSLADTTPGSTDQEQAAASSQHW